MYLSTDVSGWYETCSLVLYLYKWDRISYVRMCVPFEHMHELIAPVRRFWVVDVQL